MERQFINCEEHAQHCILKTHHRDDIVISRYTHLICLIIYFVGFFQATFKGWMDIMYAAVDSREVGRYKEINNFLFR